METSWDDNLFKELTVIGNKTVEIIDDKMYKYNSTDNKYRYNHIYFSEDREYLSSKHGILIWEDNKIVNSAVVLSSGGSTTILNDSYHIDNNFIIICCGNSLFSLSLFDLQLKWKTEIDWVTAFSITKMNDDYIVWGECTISRIDKNGKVIWKKEGSDIFVTLDIERCPFYIHDNYIFAESWDGGKYKFNYDGKDEFKK